MDAEVAVIGIGAMGSMASWQLSKKGVSVIGFEQFSPAHDISGVGGESRLFRTAYKEGEEYVPLIQEAQLLWETLEKESGSSILNINGGLTIGDPDTEEIEKVLHSIKKHNLDHEVLQYEEAKQRYPQHRLSDREIMILDKNAGFLRPEIAITSAVQLAKYYGAKIHKYTKVEEIKKDNDLVIIKANGIEYKVKKLLITTGAWTGEFLPSLKSYLTTKKLILSWFPSVNISKFNPRNFPVFSRVGPGMKLTGVPTLEGTMVKVSNNIYPETVEKPEQFNKEIPISKIKDLENQVKNFFPDLIDNSVRTSVHIDSYSLDGHPLVGVSKKHKNVVIMSGFSGHGFKMSPIMGEIASELIVYGKTDKNINHLALDRFDN